MPLATTKAQTALTNQPGRMISAARGHHLIVDSPPPLQGPNEELNPLDLLLFALSSCGVAVFERAAQELEIPLHSAAIDVEADFDPRGVKGIEGVNPRIQAFRLTARLSGPDEKQAESLVENFKQRCPVFTTLSRAAPIEFSTVLE